VREAYRKARCHDEGAEEAAVLGGFDADAAEDKGVVEGDFGISPIIRNGFRSFTIPQSGFVILPL
jgi:hypothetical protein